MKIRYNVTGAKRKELVKVISDATGARAEYKFMPTCNYEIDYFTITKDGTLLFDDRADSEEVEQVLEAITAAGFECEAQDGEEQLSEEESEAADTAPQSETVGLTVEIPLDKAAVGNLTKLLDAKGSLIKKALGVSELPIEIQEDRVAFPWFREMPDADAVKAYTHFISALCEMSKNAKRVTVTEKAVDNEKYAFRCFLLRLGFIGSEYKVERKILLKMCIRDSFKGMPVTEEQKALCEIAKSVYHTYPYDGKYILDGARLILCQSNAKIYHLKEVYPHAEINPLGDWTGGTDVDTGATNRKLGSDMADSVTGGGLHGKDLSKADVSVNIYAWLKAQETGKPVELACAIGDDTVDGIPYAEIVETARKYIQSLGGFEKFAEWGLVR